MRVLIEFIEHHSGIHASKLAEEFFSLTLAPEKTVEKDSGDQLKSETASEPLDKARLLEMRQNLHWLITEGYVME